MKVVSLVGARPQFIKEALVGKAVRQANAWQHVLVNSGQHYDNNMADVFFQDLEIPKSDYNLGIGSASHAKMTAALLVALEEVLVKEQPNALIVYGDTNTTLAGALVAAKLKIPIIHIEAGIRQEPKDMPEEINRVLTDSLSSVLCCCSNLAAENLAKENIHSGVHVVGDVMYDLFKLMKPKFTPEKVVNKLNIPEKFVICTMHRDFNVDSPENLNGILQGLNVIGSDFGLPVVFPVHPRTKARIKEFGYEHLLERVITMPPISYHDLMSLTLASRFVVTDSGGLQKEAFYAGKRAIVVMPDTGWREIIHEGWNVLCDSTRDSLIDGAKNCMANHPYPKALYGNGDAAPTLVKIVSNYLAEIN